MHGVQPAAGKTLPPPKADAVTDDSKAACTQTAPGGSQSPPPTADKTMQTKRARRLELQRDARDLLDDLGHGLSVAEICERRSWSRDAYFRRMRIAEKMANREYNPAHSMATFLKHTARYRHAQRSADARLRELETAFKDLAHSAGDNPFIVPALAHAYVRLLAFSLDCDEKTFERAIDLGFAPPLPEGKREFTVLEWINFAHKMLGDDVMNRLQANNPGLPLTPDSLEDEKP
jgi:hypothetical protein